MRRTSGVALVALFSAVVVGSDFALAPFANVKLMDAVVFVVAFVFGIKKGAAVAVVSETAWSFVSPWGVAGYITPFLVGGELLFALGGWWSSKVWGDRARLLNPNSLFIAALMLVCAFVWDFETNAATALIANWPGLTVANFFWTEVFGIPFAIVHEETDFLLGILVIPATILMIPKIGKAKQ